MLRLIYTFGTIEVAGHGLEVLFEDAVAGRLGIVSQAPPTAAPHVQPWVSSLVALAPNENLTIHPKGVALMQSQMKPGARVVELRRNTSWPSPGSARSGEEVRTLHDFFTTLSPVPGESRVAVVKLS